MDLKPDREFAAMVRGDHPDIESFRRYVLSGLRTARRRVQLQADLIINEIDRIGVALKGGFIDAETALQWLAEANVLDFLEPPEPEWTREDHEHQNPETPAHGPAGGADAPAGHAPEDAGPRPDSPISG